MAGQGLDQVLDGPARPGMRAAAMCSRKAGRREPAEAVAELRTNDPAAFGVLAEFAAGAYFMNPAGAASHRLCAAKRPRRSTREPDYLDDGCWSRSFGAGRFIGRPTVENDVP